MAKVKAGKEEIGARNTSSEWIFDCGASREWNAREWKGKAGKAEAKSRIYLCLRQGDQFNLNLKFTLIFPKICFNFNN